MPFLLYQNHIWIARAVHQCWALMWSTTVKTEAFRWLVSKNLPKRDTWFLSWVVPLVKGKTTFHQKESTGFVVNATHQAHISGRFLFTLFYTCTLRYWFGKWHELPSVIMNGTCEWILFSHPCSEIIRIEYLFSIKSYWSRTMFSCNTPHPGWNLQRKKNV